MPLNIGILMGGPSEEYEISLKTGESVYRACNALGHIVTKFKFQKNYKKFYMDLNRQDIIFNALHGGIGENGELQEWMDSKCIKYTGSGSVASALCMDKEKSKTIAKQIGLHTPEWERIHTSKQRPHLKLPYVIKPNDQGSTVGLTVVFDELNIEPAIKEAFRYGSEIIVEEYIAGKELTVPIIGEHILPIVEIIPSHQFYDYECKYTPGMSNYICPANLDHHLISEIKKNTGLLFNQLGCSVYGRADFILDKSGIPYFLEMNTLPGMTSTSLVPKSAIAEGISFNQLIKNIIELSL